MKALTLAGIALLATAGAASAQWEGTFGSVGNFGFNGTTGFSNCTSGGQGEAGVGSTDCQSGTSGSFSFNDSTSIWGNYEAGGNTTTETQSQTQNGLLNVWNKSGHKNGVDFNGTTQVGNITQSASVTTDTSGFAITGGTIDQNTSTSFNGTGYTNTTSTFGGGGGNFGMPPMGCMMNCGGGD